MQSATSFITRSTRSRSSVGIWRSRFPTRVAVWKLPSCTASTGNPVAKAGAHSCITRSLGSTPPVSTSPAMRMPLITASDTARMMSSRSAGVMISLSGANTFTELGTVIAHSRTSRKRRCRMSPSCSTRAPSAPARSFTRSAESSSRWGTTATGTSRSATTAAAQAASCPSSFTGTRLRMQLTCRPSPRSPKPRAAMASSSASSTGPWSLGAPTSTSSASRALSISVLTRDA